jgi:Type II secretion system (T2SS), protein G
MGNKRLTFTVGGVLMLVIAGLFLWGRINSTKELKSLEPWVTYSTAMYVASRGCGDYEQQYRVWPDSLDKLRAFRGDINERCKDAWGRNFVFIPYNKSLGYGEIISYGRDEKPGGTGLDGDIVIRFPTDANAAWNKEQGEELKGPQRAP